MIDQKDFVEIQKHMDLFDRIRDDVIKKSRDVVKLSKQIIYSVHRDEIHKAEKLKEKIKISLGELVGMTKEHNALYYSGSLKVAEQEFVEALVFLEFVKNKSLPSFEELNVQIENYLLGLCDLTGELVRRAINCSIKENFDDAVAAKNAVSEIYDQLMQFDFRNGELRRKFDSIKYDLKKLEDLVLQLKLKDKV
jgi:predicted translin family RNA/ssDNA-binding protein